MFGDEGFAAFDVSEAEADAMNLQTVTDGNGSCEAHNSLSVGKYLVYGSYLHAFVPRIRCADHVLAVSAAV